MNSPQDIYSNSALHLISTSSADALSSNAARTDIPGLRDTSSTPPWGSWELDATFFRALSESTLARPETALDRVLEKVVSAIDSGKRAGYLDVIPDSPFPARSLVLALAHLVELGVTMTGAKLEVRKFAREIIAWVSDITSSFTSMGEGRFTEETWKNLAKMRNLIDEICTWATLRLRDGPWSPSKLKIKDDITEFKTRFTEAREVFRDRSLISISGGIDTILGMILAILGELTTIMTVLMSIRRTQIQLKESKARQTYLNDTLVPHTVADPTYVKQGKLPCDEDTRVEVLTTIRDWIDDVSEGSQNFLWLTGNPGCGKSAITATIAQRCKDLNELWAQFFINRNNADTTNPNLYFPSMARQLAAKSADVERRIHDALKQQPSLVDRLSPEQAAKLFIDAVVAAALTDPERPVLIVIDGLDETTRAHLRTTATMFSNLFKTLSKYRNAKILISSRTEDDIWKPFTETMKVKDVKRIHLKTSDPLSIRDVSAYLTKRVRQIALDNHLDPEEWFGKESLAKLTLRASGLFIWAVTVEKLLQTHIEQQGKEGLRSVLEKLDSDKMTDINTLYSTILDLTYDRATDEWAFEKFRRVVGAIVVLREPLSLGHLELLLNLRQHSRSDPVDIQNLVRRLRTVLVTDTDEINHTTIPRLHKSFVEFITGDYVNRRYQVDQVVSNSEVAVQCLYHLTDAYSAIHAAQIQPSSSHIVSLSTHFRYALRFHVSHLSQREIAAGDRIIIATEAHTMDLPKLHTLLRWSSNEKYLGPLRITTPKDRPPNAESSPFFSRQRSHNQKGNPRIFTSLDNRIDVWDAASGYPVIVTPVTTLKGHTGGVWCVSFSPDGRQISSGSTDSTVRLWDARTNQPIGSPWMGHDDLVRSVCFSPDGNKVASGSDDNTIRIWNTKTGDTIGTPLIGHNGWVTSVTFSPDGKRLISASNDTTIRIWDVQNCQTLRASLGAHSSRVYCVTLSSDGAQIFSGSGDKTIRLWDSYTGEPIGLPLEGHDSSVRCIALSRNSNYIVSGSSDYTIRLWDARTGKPMASPWVGHTDSVYSVTFSPNDSYVLSGSDDGSIRLWDVESGQTVVTFARHTGGVNSAALSPDGKRVVSATDGQELCVWDIPSVFLEQKFQARFTAFSPSGKLVLSGDSNHTIRLWKTDMYDVNVDDAMGTGPDENAGGGRIEGRPLEGEGIILHSAIFSPDDSRIAGVSSDGTIYLWHAETCSLLSRSLPNSVNSAESLTFTSEGRSIVVGYSDAKSPSRIWTATDGKLVNLPEVSQLPQIYSPTFFDMAQSPHIYDEAGNSRLRSIHWYSGSDTGNGFWAYVNNHIVRGQDDGSVVIVPVGSNNVRG